MLLLLDTHILLWALAGDAKLSPSARQIIEAPETTVFISSVSIWEIVIKQSLGKLEADAREIVQGVERSGFIFLPFDQRHALAVAALPDLHKDPFDRALIAQSMAEPLILLTADEQLARYGTLIRLV